MTAQEHLETAAELVRIHDQISPPHPCAGQRPLIWLKMQMHLAAASGEYLSEAQMGGRRYRTEVGQ